ncbi:hypothetical protein IMZ48_24800 [Candidatus Bathyarchaeota archaeon]|nr:hypothetical protein [Candidatus Bathyarchaeota archaeon]
MFLEESVVPYIPISPRDTNGVPWNAYVYDFFKHGNLQALVTDNGIKSGDVWFHLKDFSLVLATVTTSLSNFFNAETTDDDAMMDIDDDNGDAAEEIPEEPMEGEEVAPVKPEVKEAPKRVVAKPKKKKAVVVDSWDDSEDESSSGEETEEEEARGPKGKIEDNELMLVVTAFTQLKEEFDEKFRKIGS